ncbi:hypothetical protein DFS34DRAFT_390762 [Phlyctochytrium arcticum]|nr:hypothetical protein DFS34DRAFT_390762 [Phlyctochytrium arcticum]
MSWGTGSSKAMQSHSSTGSNARLHKSENPPSLLEGRSTSGGMPYKVWSFETGAGARWQFRSQQVAEKRYSRLIEHLNRFMRVHVHSTLEPITLIVDSLQSVEDLAQRIEVELFARALQDAQSEDVDLKPFECCLLYDVNMSPLDFEDRIGDVIGHDENVHVMTLLDSNTESQRSSLYVTEGSTDTDVDTQSLIARGQQSIDEPLTQRAKNFQNAVARTKHLSFDEKLQNILHHRVGLDTFAQFCALDHTLEKLLFWIDVEVLQDVSREYVGPFSHYIYATYICEGCPIPINVRIEAKNDVARSVRNFGRSTFDECQELVYRSLKGQTFVKFVKSKDYEAYEHERLQGGVDYAHGFLRESYHEAVPPDWKLVDELLEALANPASRQVTVSPEDGSSSTAVRSPFSSFFPPADGSMPWNVQVLSVILKHYFPQMSTPRTYFQDAHNVSSAKKKSKINKEKKLTKFFGVHPTNDVLYRQLMAAARVAVGSEEALLSGSQSDDLNEPTADSTTADRKRRFSKLHNFFGEHLPATQLRLQQLAMQQDSSQSLVKVSSDPRRPRSHTISTYTPPAARRHQNELDPKDKRRLVKQSQKLKAVLGEPVKDSSILAVPIATNVRRRSVGEMSHEQSDEFAPLSGRKARSDNTVASTPSEDAISKADDPSFRWQPSASSLHLDHRQHERTLLRRKVQKLVRLLGDGVQEVITNPIAKESFTESNGQLAVAGPPQHPSSLNTTPAPLVSPYSIASIDTTENFLTSEQRSERVKRAVKLTNVFGKAPPTQMYSKDGEKRRWDAPDETALLHRRAIQGLRSVLREKKFTGLLVQLADLDAEPKEPPTVAELEQRIIDSEADLSTQSNESLTTEIARLIQNIEETEHQKRRKQFNKLKRFFGDSSFSAVKYIEDNIVSRLEDSIEIDVQNPRELSELRREIATLRLELEKQRDQLNLQIAVLKEDLRELPTRPEEF